MFKFVVALFSLVSVAGILISPFIDMLFTKFCSKLLIIFLFFLFSTAFAPIARKVSSNKLQMNIFPENPTGIYGDLAPVGFFDPIGLSKGKDAATLKQWRDAEIKHGRVCMLASVGLLTQELLKNPVGVDGPAIRHLDILDDKFPEFGELFILLCAFIEGWTIVNKWEPRSETRGLKRFARLRDDVEPGDLSWVCHIPNTYTNHTITIHTTIHIY